MPHSVPAYVAKVNNSAVEILPIYYILVISSVAPIEATNSPSELSRARHGEFAPASVSLATPLADLNRRTTQKADRISKTIGIILRASTMGKTPNINRFSCVHSSLA